MDPRNRFSSRVENYIKYRPGYPVGVVETLRNECGLAPGSLVADVGSGTGLLARLFLDFGCHVFGVEPNLEMRAAGERLLAHYRLFSSAAGSAEATGLPTASMDLVTAGQAFHWFDPVLTRQEFRRILKPSGWVALIWNERRLDSTPFLRAYEDLLQKYGVDYNQINHRNVEQNPETIPAFFGGEYRVARFDNVQMFQFDGVRGRLESSSYIPEPGHPNYEPMLTELQSMFDRYQQDGMVAFEYDTRMFYGRLAESSTD
jgi:SAM-dependent methyltransferase